MKQNSVRLIGFVGKQPVVSEKENSAKRASIRLATHHVVRGEDKEKKFVTTWHDVIAWGELAELAGQSFMKGSHIMVDGRLVYRTYTDPGGVTRSITEIRADSLVNLSRPSAFLTDPEKEDNRLE
jgi:single-strand DNA-binding protein